MRDLLRWCHLSDVSEPQLFPAPPAFAAHSNPFLPIITSGVDREAVRALCDCGGARLGGVGSRVTM